MLNYKTVDFLNTSNPRTLFKNLTKTVNGNYSKINQDHTPLNIDLLRGPIEPRKIKLNILKKSAFSHSITCRAGEGQQKINSYT